jgi:ComF family protein
MPSLLDRLVSLAAPSLCLACRVASPPDAVCRRCRAGLVALPGPRCRRCGSPAGAAVPPCQECRGRALAFAGAWAPFAYEGTARRLVAALKHRGATRAAAFMSDEIAARAPPGLLAGVLVPVPAHPARRRRTGMNQAACLARALSRRTGLPVAQVLARARGSTPQVGLARRERLANARGSVRAGRGPPAGRLVLVDDVYTTGATLDACARALLVRGADEAVAITFARALR